MTTATRTSAAAHRPVTRMASGARVMNYTLADPEMQPRIQALSKRLTGSKEESVKFLKKVGILNRSGKLSKNFGG
jgi:hypothetical protein